MKMFHVYEDWTTEETPRCFYVGKGDDSRVARLKRANERHTKVASTLGHNRIVVFSTADEHETFEVEKRFIRERHTHPRDPEFNGIGCNRTLGGQGNSGRIVSDETRRKMSESKKGKHPNRVWTQSDRNAVATRMSILHKGKKISDAQKSQISVRMKQDIAAHGNYTAKLSVEQVKELKSIWQEKAFPRRSRLIGPFIDEWAQKFGVKKSTIYYIVTGRRWANA